MTTNLFEMVQALKMAAEVTVNVLFPISTMVMAGFTVAVVREFFKIREKEEAAVVEISAYEELLQAA